MTQLNKLIKSYIFYMLSALGISLTIKASIGVSSLNTMNLALSSALSIKIGTITMIINMIFLAIYMHMTKYKLIKKYMIQTISVVLFGTFINFFTYTVLADLIFEDYILRVLTVVLGTIVSGSAVGMIVSYNTITFPIESVCVEMAERTKYTFTMFRYSIDVFSVMVSLSLTALFALPLYVREGTLISLAIFSFTMGTVKERFSKRLAQASVS